MTPSDAPENPDDDDDTQPLWPTDPGAHASAGLPTHDHYSWPYDQPSHTQPSHTQPLPMQPGYLYPYGYQQPRPPPTKVPAWLWPVVAATALVVGLLGGTLGGVAVSRSLNDDNGGGALSGPDGEVAAPLDPEDGSVAAVADRLLPSVVQILAKGGEGRGATGSGFVLDGKGHIITNNHVVSGAAENSGDIEVIDQAGRRKTAKIVGRSPVYDIAVLHVDGTRGLKPVALGSSRSMNVGETVVAIGSPLGLSSTVTSGIVSAVDRPVTTGDADESSYINAVQTDAAINPGNSGGPLVNLRGEVVGVNSAIATVGTTLGGEGGNIGVGFAIPMEQVRRTAKQILDTGKAEYPVIGANVDTSERNRGAEIVEVPSGTPADDAGLEEGDVVVRVGDTRVTDGIGLIVAIRTHEPGEKVEMLVRRDGDEMVVQITLDSKVG